ncbi:MAG: rhodanese-like domain-containing protein [Bacteroidota bacterium]
MKAYPVLEMPSQRIIAVGLVAVLLLAFVAVPAAFAETSGSGAYKDITVDEAYKMMKAHKDLVVLDVRNQSEYKLGHLYDAVLIPVYELEDRISELQEHINDPIIVYCKAGSRSQIACEILVSHGFTKVYNMFGGITAWIEAGYPIYTTYHYVTLDVAGKHAITQIEPLLLYQTGCTSCGCQSCIQNQTCPNANVPSNITVTTIEQNENTTITLIIYEVDGATYEVTVTQTLLWSYNELTDEINRTASFVSTEITAEGTFMEFYSLSYMVQHEEYNLTLYTTLTPLNSEIYNSSFTVMNYAPVGKSELVSLEFVDFNYSVTLSQQYAVLGKVAKEVGKVYEKSGDETLAQLAQGYYTMQGEAKHLAKLVEKQLPEYDREILSARALISDDRVAVCSFSQIGFSIVFYCLNPLQPLWVIVGACCAALYGVVLGAAAGCVATAGIACLLAILAAIAIAWASLAGCYTTCPSMQACIVVCFLWWCWDLVCMQMW